MNDVVLQEDTPGASPGGVTGDKEAHFFDQERARHAFRMRKLEIGWVGWPFGGGAEKSANIAMLTIFICLAIAGAICYHVDLVKNPDLFSKIVSPFLSIITLALGYIFGSSNKGDSEPRDGL